MNIDDVNAPIVEVIRCNRDCSSDCEASQRGWYVAEDPESGKFDVLAGHDTDSIDEDGELLPEKGAWWQTATEEQFDTREAAEAFLKEHCR